MKILTPLVCVLTLLLTHTAVQADGLYKWTDARGNTQYGDTPPPNVNAKSVNLPKITIIEKYADQWKPMKFDNSQPATQERIVAKQSNAYSKLSFLAPKANQAIRANDGDVSAMISIKPPLKNGHNLVFSIDGKETAKGKSRTQNFSNLGRGEHVIGVKVVNQQGKTLKSSSVSFNVLRFSKLSQQNSDSLENKTQVANQATKVRSYNQGKRQLELTK